MKKYFFYSMFIIIFGISSSCDKNDVIDPKLTLENLNTNNVCDELVDIYANARFGKTKGNTLKVEPIAKNKDTLAYIINYGDGWELLAGDERYTPILAKGEGEYNVEKLNPGQRIWLESELERVKAVKQGNLLVDKEVMQKNKFFWKKLRGPQAYTKAEGDPIEDNRYWELVEIIDYDYEVETTGHLVDTQWGQDEPWNTFIPYVDGNSGNKCLAGCVAVAGAQLLRFLHYDIGKPTTCYTYGVFSGDKNNYNADFYNPSSTAWDDMALHRLDIFKDTLLSALLIAEVAYNTLFPIWNFNEDNTHEMVSKFKNFLDDMGISYIRSDYDDMEHHISYYLVTKGQPCLVSASTSILGIINGHAWLIDGYRKDIFYKKYIYRWTSRTDNHLYEYDERKEEIEEVEYNYVLMNWGYDGYGDDNLYAASVYADWQVSDYDFEYNRKIIYDFN